MASIVFYVAFAVVAFVGVWLYHNVNKASGGKGVPVIGAFLDQYTLVLNFVDQDQKKPDVVGPDATDAKKSDSKAKKKKSKHKKSKDPESKSRTGKKKKKHSRRSKHNKKSKHVEGAESASSDSTEVPKTDDQNKKVFDADTAVEKK